MKLSNVTKSALGKNRQSAKVFYSFLCAKLTMRLLCRKLINYSLVWIFTRKIHMMLPNSMDFARVKLRL